MFPLSLVGFVLTDTPWECVTGWVVRIWTGSDTYRLRQTFSTEAEASVIAEQLQADGTLASVSSWRQDRRFSRMRDS